MNEAWKILAPEDQAKLTPRMAKDHPAKAMLASRMDALTEAENMILQKFYAAEMRRSFAEMSKDENQG
jgi:hypothetical protein